MKPFFPFSKTYIVEWSNPDDARSRQTIVEIWVWACPSKIMKRWGEMYPNYNLHNMRKL